MTPEEKALLETIRARLEAQREAFGKHPTLWRAQNVAMFQQVTEK